MHSRADRGLRVALLALLAFALLAGPADASVVIPPADDDLIVRADAVILGRVTDIESHDNQQGKLHTYITIAIDEVLKGTLPQPTLTIRELGGQVGGVAGWVFANPEFTVGERVLLFLDQRDDGTLRVLHFYLGKFSVITDPGSGDLVAVRPLPEEVVVIAPPGAAAPGIALGAVGRGLDEFKARIREKAGEPRPLTMRPSPGLQLSSARRPAGGLVERHQDFRFLRDPNPPTATNPSLVQPRFSQPDTNTPIVMHFNSTTEPLAPGGSDGGREQVRAAFRAWSRVATTSFRFVEGSPTAAQGFNNDSVNTVTFRDPDGDIPAPSGCSGVLAVGGMFFSTTPTMTVNGRQFSQAVEADLVFADGWEACTFLPDGGYYQSFSNLTEVAAHELGHTLGLGHSEASSVDAVSGLDGATMEPFAHFDGRAATLHADDKAGITFIYPGRTLTIQKTGGGDGSITSGTVGIDCGPDCVAGFAFNSTVTLTATPVAPATFQGFVEAGCGPTTVTMTSDKTCTAIFTTDTDLAISAISGPAVAAPGTSIVLNNTVRNSGLPAGAFTVGLYLATSASVTQADRQLTTRQVAGLAFNTTSADATSVLIPSDVTPGSYFLGAIADINGDVTEGNETNNSASTPIIIAKPDRVVTTLTVPATAGAGQTISANSTVKNQATTQLGLTQSPAVVAGLKPDWRALSNVPFHLSPPAGVTNPVLTASMVTDAPASFVADPFLFQDNQTWYMFVEILDTQLNRGRIAVAKSLDGLRWTYDRIVLTQPNHLSYPFVFKYNGEYFMMPEFSTRNAVALFRSQNFPYDWTEFATLVSGRTFRDPSLFFYNGTWWLFVSDGTSSNCYLYYSDSLTSDWVEHPQSPVIRNDKSKARLGGRSLVVGNHVYRVAQKDDVVYGEAVRVFAVDVLTKTSYAEHEIAESPVLKASGTGWNKTGMHQLDLWWTGQRWLGAVDGRSAGDNSFSVGIYEALNPPAGLVVGGVQAASGRVYTVVPSGLQVGTRVYTDRTYTFTSVPPALTGQTYIQTANDDKASTGDTFLRFDVNQPVTVYVAHDDLITPKPAWLGTFVDTGWRLVTTDKSLSVFARNFPAGNVVLGGNGGPLNSMYSVVVVGRAAPALDHIAVEGSTTVNESSTATYAVRAFYTDGSNRTVTPSLWTETCAAATIASAGVLTAGAVSANETCSVSASYAEGTVSKSAALSITIRNVPPSACAVVTNIVVASGKAYHATCGLQPGQQPYIDRTYTFTTGIPPLLLGQTYIQTANDDKASTGTSFLRFVVDRNVTVYVAHDDLITPKPAWLGTFVDTGWQLVTTDKSLSVFARNFPAGNVVLGGNGGPLNSMYSVVVRPQ